MSYKDTFFLWDIAYLLGDIPISLLKNLLNEYGVSKSIISEISAILYSPSSKSLQASSERSLFLNFKGDIPVSCTKSLLRWEGLKLHNFERVDMGKVELKFCSKYLMAGVIWLE